VLFLLLCKIVSLTLKVLNRPKSYPHGISETTKRRRKISKLLSLTAPLEEVSDRQRRLDVPWIQGWQGHGGHKVENFDPKKG